MSASKDLLDNELNQISIAFPNNHPVCQFINSDDNQIHFKFLLEGTHSIVCEIVGPYATAVPTWTSDSDNDLVKETLEELLKSTFATKFKVTAMLRVLITRLCEKFNVRLPPELMSLGRNLPPEADADESSDEEKSQEVNADEPIEGRSAAATASTSASAQPKAQSASAARATKRLMKEFQAINDSQYVKDGFFSVSLENDNLFEWNVKVFKVDPDCRLHQDLQTMKEEMGKDAIGLGITFKETYPFDPPFMRVLYPVIKGGYVMNGGAICLEVLTSDGWSSVYTIESLILQVIAAFAKGGARIVLGVTTEVVTIFKIDVAIQKCMILMETYNYTNALRNFSRLSALHDSTGWYSSMYDRS